MFVLQKKWGGGSQVTYISIRKKNDLDETAQRWLFEYIVNSGMRQGSITKLGEDGKVIQNETYPDFRFPEQAISEKCIMVMCGQSSNHYLETDILSFEPVDCQRKLCGLYTI